MVNIEWSWGESKTTPMIIKHREVIPDACLSCGIAQKLNMTTPLNDMSSLQTLISDVTDVSPVFKKWFNWPVTFEL